MVVDPNMVAGLTELIEYSTSVAGFQGSCETEVNDLNYLARNPMPCSASPTASPKVTRKCGDMMLISHGIIENITSEDISFVILDLVGRPLLSEVLSSNQTIVIPKNIVEPFVVSMNTKHCYAAKLVTQLY